MVVEKLGPPSIERYKHNGYVIDVEENLDPDGGLLWDFWICAAEYGIKLHAVGIPGRQPYMTPPRIQTREEVLDMFFRNVDAYIKDYDREIADIEALL